MPWTIQLGTPQKDGKQFVTERHSDALGEFAVVEYRADTKTDYEATAAKRHPQLLADYAKDEARSIVDQGLRPTPRFQTVPELLLKVRERYRSSTQDETCVIARWIVQRLGDGSIATSQCATAWGVNAGGWNAINGRMDGYMAALDAVLVAKGE